MKCITDRSSVGATRLNTQERLAGRWRPIKKTLFQKERWKNNAGCCHTRVKRGNLGHRDVGYGSSPTNRIAIQMLPYCLRCTGVNRRVIGEGGVKSPRSQSQNQ